MTTTEGSVLLVIIALLAASLHLQTFLLMWRMDRQHRALRLHEKILRELVHRSETGHSHPDHQETP